MKSERDVISIRGLTVEACHGVLAHEKTAPQPFLLDIDLTMDLGPAGRSDDLADTVSYADVALDAAAVLAGESVDLIEHLAERVADACLARLAVQSVSVTVHKPQAPIGFPVTDAAVTVQRSREATAVIGLGANLSAPVARLTDAVRRLAAHDAIDPLVVSPLLETDPVGGPPDQSPYANAVLVVRTSLAPRALLRVLHEIETVHGRTRPVRWGPRTLDLDLLAYADERVGGEVRSDAADCTLPHPRAHERAFVVVPWLLADPAAQLPRTALAALMRAPESLPGAEPAPVTESLLVTDPATEPATEVAALADGELATWGIRRGPDWPTQVAECVMVAPW